RAEDAGNRPRPRRAARGGGGERRRDRLPDRRGAARGIARAAGRRTPAGRARRAWPRGVARALVGGAAHRGLLRRDRGSARKARMSETTEELPPGVDTGWRGLVASFGALAAGEGAARALGFVAVALLARRLGVTAFGLVTLGVSLVG